MNLFHMESYSKVNIFPKEVQCMFIIEVIKHFLGTLVTQDEKRTYES